MGTFHDNKGELHGITVVVDTHGPMVYVGRCDTMDERSILLLDVDEHQDGQRGRSKVQYLERAKKYGTWKKHSRLQIPMSDVSSVQRLGEWAASEINAPAPVGLAASPAREAASSPIAE